MFANLLIRPQQVRPRAYNIAIVSCVDGQYISISYRLADEAFCIVPMDDFGFYPINNLTKLAKGVRPSAKHQTYHGVCSPERWLIGDSMNSSWSDFVKVWQMSSH